MAYRRFWRALWPFCVVGPPIGGLPFSLVGTFGVDLQGGTADTLLQTLSTFLQMQILVYAFGLIPALMAGVIFSILLQHRHRLPVARTRADGALLGACAAAMAAAISPVTPLWSLLGVLSVVAGIICGTLHHGLYRRPESSVNIDLTDRLAAAPAPNDGSPPDGPR